jgi:hypothetical protein
VIARASILRPTPRPPRERASVLVTAMLLSIAIGAGIVAYLRISTQALSFSQRAFYLKDAAALAEAGLEEALFCFHQMDAGQPVATAWTGWTLTNGNATRTLPTFNRDQNAVGTVKIFVGGYDGTNLSPFVHAQATVAPFDGSPLVVKTLRIKLRKTAFFVRGVVARNGLSWTGQASADSFNSNPTNSATGPWLAYPAAGATANTMVIVPAGTMTLGSQCLIRGNLALGPGVTAPAANKVTGQISNTFTGSFPVPVYPTSSTVTQSYSLGASVPATLPRAGDVAAADGRYYYFFEGATITNTTIAIGKKVSLVGRNTSLGSGIGLTAGASCLIYIDGAINAGSGGAINNSNWAGALQIFTTTTAACSIGGNGQIYACVYAPNAALTCNGGGSTGMLVGSFVANTVSSSGHMDFHYDEALRLSNDASPWTVNGWFDLQSAADRTAVAGLTGGYLR